MESGLKIFSNDIPTNGKRVIVRLDLNVPIKNSKIEDITRIKIIEPFFNKLIENKAKIILITHLGRPKGKRFKNYRYSQYLIIWKKIKYKDIFL